MTALTLIRRTGVYRILVAELGNAKATWRGKVGWQEFARAAFREGVAPAHG